MLPYTIICAKQTLQGTPHLISEIARTQLAQLKRVSGTFSNSGTFQDIGIARPRKHNSSAAGTREALAKYFFLKKVLCHGS